VPPGTGGAVGPPLFLISPELPQQRLPHPFDFAHGRLFVVFEGLGGTGLKGLRSHPQLPEQKRINIHTLLNQLADRLALAVAGFGLDP